MMTLWYIPILTSLTLYFTDKKMSRPFASRSLGKCRFADLFCPKDDSTKPYDRKITRGDWPRATSKLTPET